MDDRFIYLLNGLLARDHTLGRIARFRHLHRGRQAQAVELLTAEGREFVAWLYPPHFSPALFDPLATVLAALAEQRFPAAPLVPTTAGHFAAEGPQGQSLVVSQAAPGVALPRDEWTAQMLALVGLRLGWMHRLLAALPTPVNDPLPARAAEAFNNPSARAPTLPNILRDALLSATDPIEGMLPIHRDWSPDSILLDSDRQIRSIVDWGRLAPGCAEEDLLTVFQQWCVQPDGTVRSEELRIFLEAYRSLCPLPLDPAQRWEHAATRWLAAAYADAFMGIRPLPRGWMTMAREPRAVADALLLCEPK